jgi:hypothetical protein
MDIRQAREANKGKVIVWYPFQLGGQWADRGMWCAEKDGEVLDYDRRKYLIADALRDGESVVVFTLHKGGEVTVKEVK